jgi:hypothetical protein
MTGFGSGIGGGRTETVAAEAMLRQVRGYWQALRVGDALPLRARIDPRGIEGALERAFLIERIGPGQARFRLAGSFFADLLGMDLRHLPVAALFDPLARPRLAEVLEQVFTAPAVAELALEADRGLGRPALSGRMLILPVVGEGEAPLAFGCLPTEGDIGRAPRRFLLARALVERLDLPPAAGLAEPRGGAQRRVEMQPPPRAVAGRRHLRLVKG